MATFLRRTLLVVFSLSSLAALLAGSPVRAGLITTDEVLQAQSERDHVKALIARPGVASKLESLGVLPKDAQARVDALTDEEVHALAGRVDALPAGGTLTTQEWLLIIIAILLVVIIL